MTTRNGLARELAALRVQVAALQTDTVPAWHAPLDPAALAVQLATAYPPLALASARREVGWALPAVRQTLQQLSITDQTQDWAPLARAMSVCGPPPEWTLAIVPEVAAEFGTASATFLGTLVAGIVLSQHRLLGTAPQDAE